MKPLTLLLGLIFFTPVIAQQKVKITVKGLKGAVGTVRIAIFKDNTSFENEKPFKTVSIDKKKFLQESLTCYVSLAQGYYGFALLDDENNNDQMDKSFFGIPLEGFGFSNYVHSGIFAPHFDDFKYRVRSGQSNEITIKLKYM